MENLNRVHLNGLRAVEAVHRLGSLQAAAEEFRVSVGAISQQVAKAEAQLGLVLFERRPKGLVATGAALPALARLHEAFAGLSDAVRLAERRDPSILTISVAPVFAARWLVRRLDRFAESYPDLRLRIDASSQLVDLGSSDIDLAIRVGDGSWPHVRAELLMAQEIFPVVAPEISSRLKGPEDLAHVPMVIDDRAMFSWDVWLKAAGVPGLSRTIGHRLNEASLCLDAVMAGQGVMLAWQTLASDAVAQGRLCIPFATRALTGFGHYAVTPGATPERPAVKAFKAWMRAELSESMAALEKAFPRD